MGTYLAYIIGGAVGGLLFVWWVIGQLKAKEQADLTNAGLQAHDKGELDAEEAENAAKVASDAAKKGENANPLDM
jgi:hypothetical protein